MLLCRDRFFSTVLGIDSAIVVRIEVVMIGDW